MTPSSQANVRRSDYRFERTQSREMAKLPWEHRSRAIQTWRGDIAAAIAVILLGILAFPAAELLSLLVAP